MALTPIVVRDGNNAAQNMDALQDPSGNNMSIVSTDSTRATYRVSASFTPQPTAAVTMVTVTGSATKTVRIKRILLGGASTALSVAPIIALQRTSALGAGGTLVAPTVAKLDTNSAPATAVVNHWTTTLKAAGTPVGGAISTVRLFSDTVTTPTVASRAATVLFPEGGAPIGQAIVLRGTSDFLEIQNVNAGNLAAGTVLEYAIEFEEDGS
jgi:hypothetical protein